MKKKKILLFASSFMSFLVIVLIGYYILNYTKFDEILPKEKLQNQQDLLVTQAEPSKVNENKKLTATPQTVRVDEKISNENVIGMSKALLLHLNESQSLTGLIATKSNINSLALSVISNDGKPLGVYLSMKPEAKSFNLSEVIVDTKIEPFNKPGEYKLQIWANTDENAEDTKIGEIPVKVLPIENTKIKIELVKIETDNYPIIKAAFTALDKTGRPIDNISKEQVFVYEKKNLNDLNEINITVDKLEISNDSKDGMNLALTFDSSLSMYNKDKSEKGSLMEKAKRSAISFIESKKLSSNDKVAIISFGKDFTIHQMFTNDKTKIINAIKHIKSRPDTAIFDAVSKSANVLEGQQGQRNLIIFTDGEDNSSKLTYKDAIKASNDANVSVFSIALGESAKTNEFKSISDKTNGEFYYLNDPKMLSNYYDRITQSIKNQYIVTYKSTTDATMKERVLRLRIKHESDDCSAQKSYIR